MIQQSADLFKLYIYDQLYSYLFMVAIAIAIYYLLLLQYKPSRVGNELNRDIGVIDR